MNYKHGLTGNPLYQRCINILNRCYNQNHPDYRNWGKRNIKVWQPWKENIVLMVSDFKKLGWKKGLQIDRYPDNDGDYVPWNIRFTNNRNNNSNKQNSIAGLIGTTWGKANNKWKGQIEVKGKRIHLGSFDTRYEAALAYDQALDKYGLDGRRNFNPDGSWKYDPMPEYSTDELLDKIINGSLKQIVTSSNL